MVPFEWLRSAELSLIIQRPDKINSRRAGGPGARFVAASLLAIVWSEDPDIDEVVLDGICRRRRPGAHA
jgi:hypothetical protein